MLSRPLPDLSLRRSALPLPRSTEPRPVVAIPGPEDGEAPTAVELLRRCDLIDRELDRLGVSS